MPAAATNNSRAVISPKSYITLGLLILIVGAASAGVSKWSVLSTVAMAALSREDAQKLYVSHEIYTADRATDTANMKVLQDDMKRLQVSLNELNTGLQTHRAATEKRRNGEGPAP